MNKPDPIALTRTHDPAFNAAQQIAPDATSDQIATWAVMIEDGASLARIREMVMRVRAVLG